MTDLPGSAAIGIEAVEWLAEGGGNLIVRITGRWRRRRPAAGGQATLVIEAEGRRHRFPALPEPPSLTGASPGMWQLRFSVPGSLAPDLGGRTWLQFGTVIVPLPAAVAPPGDPGPPEARIETPAPAHEPPGLVPAPEPEPDLIGVDPPAPGPEAETDADADKPLDWVAPTGDREAARLRLERELLARRAGTRVRVPTEPRVRAAPARTSPESPASAAAPAAPAAPAATTAAGPTAPAAGVPSPAAGLAADQLVHTLRRELDARAGSEAALRARLVDAEARLAARVLLDQRTSVLLGQLRTELEGLRERFSHERELRERAERRAAVLERELGGQRERSRGAREAIGELREAMEQLMAPQADEAPAPAPSPSPEIQAASPDAMAAASDATAAGVGPPDPAGPVEPARLNEALARLRQAVEPHAAAEVPSAALAPVSAEKVSRPTLRASFQRLVRDDDDAAGRILLELLSLQREAYPHPVSYDLVLGAGRGCVSVSVAGGPAEIALRSDPRPAEAVDFQVFGEPARIARMLTVHGLRRRLARRRGRVTGRRERLAALEALLDMPLDLGMLHRAGVRLDPCAALELVAQMIDPRWTLRERFTLAHREPEGGMTYLEVSDGGPITVTRQAPEGRIATTIVCSSDDLLPALTGVADGGLRVDGDQGPLAALREWIKRAQSDQSR